VRRELLSVATMVPDIELPCVPRGVAVRLRENGGKITVLVAVHSGSCPGCREYLETVGGQFG
jgi:hypothetical protein